MQLCSETPKTVVREPARCPSISSGPEFAPATHTVTCASGISLRLTSNDEKVSRPAGGTYGAVISLLAPVPHSWADISVFT